jgi:hypothetical protein
VADRIKYVVKRGKGDRGIAFELREGERGKAGNIELNF